MINVALIGCGYWGINYVRVFSEIPEAQIVLACDASEERLRVVRERYPLIQTTANYEEALNSRHVDAAIVATDAFSHYQIARQCLMSGKHVLVEKPLATDVSDSESLIQVADEQKRILMVGHTFLYNAGVRKMKELVSRDDFGRIYYVHATRTNMGPVRHDVNAVWDLASHDIAIFNYLLDAQPVWVSAVGSKVLGGEQEDVAFATLGYLNEVIANIHASWLDPNKVRGVVVVGSQRRIVFDDLNNVERVRIYEKGVSPAPMEADSFGEFRLLVRDGDIISPRVEASEPLRNVTAHFVECVASGSRPLTDGYDGLHVVKVMSAIQGSMNLRGAPVTVG